MIIGFFLIRPIPLDYNEKAEQYEPVSAHPDHLAPGLSQRNDSQSPLLSPERSDDEGSESEVEEENSIPRTPGFVGEAGLAPDRAVREHDVEMSPTRHTRRLSTPRHSPRSLSRSAAVTHDTTPNVHGLKLWKSPDFYLLFSILSLCEFFREPNVVPAKYLLQ
jgi:hypothetical protein